MPEIDVAAATEALNAAGGVEALMSAEANGTEVQVSVAPTVTPSEGGSEAVKVTPSSTAQERDEFGRWKSVENQPVPVVVTPTVETPYADTPFTNIDPTTLSPELQSVYKSMQADYTRKAQEIATNRKELETLGPLDNIKQAIELQQTLADPTNWPALYQELTDNLKQMGYNPQEASAIAANAVQDAAVQQKEQTPLDLSALENDPDLAPVKTLIEGLQNQVKAVQDTLAAEQEKARNENMRLAVIGELTRQENIIRESHKEYTDADINSIYELSSYHDGNLLKAQERYDQMFQDRLTRYLDGKQGAAAHNATNMGGASTTSVVAPQGGYKTLDEAHVAALEALRQIDAQG